MVYVFTKFRSIPPETELSKRMLDKIFEFRPRTNDYVLECRRAKTKFRFLIAWILSGTVPRKRNGKIRRCYANSWK